MFFNMEEERPQERLLANLFMRSFLFNQRWLLMIRLAGVKY